VSPLVVVILVVLVLGFLLGVVVSSLKLARRADQMAGSSRSSQTTYSPDEDD